MSATAKKTIPFDREREILLVMFNREGSVQHYYHFILGFLKPLMLAGPPPAGKTYVVRSCGAPMDRLLDALQLPYVRRLPLEDFNTLRRNAANARLRLQGFDQPIAYDGAKMLEFRKLILGRLNITPAPAADNSVLLINRGRPAEFYMTVDGKPRPVSNLRRSIPNMDDINASIAAAGFQPRLTELENIGFREQVQLFADATMLVAQHGAALLNMLWMVPGARVVEIRPAGVNARFFREMAVQLGHAYVDVRQPGPHGAVRPQLVVHALKATPDPAHPGRVLEEPRILGNGEHSKFLLASAEKDKAEAAG